MKIENYLPFIRWSVRLGWWAILVGLMTQYLGTRLVDLKAGLAVPADIVVFFVWIAVALLPLLTEITFFGVTFKKHIDDLKKEVRDDISSLRSEVQTAVSVKQHLSQQFVLAPAPADSVLPEIEKRVKEALDREFRSRGRSPAKQEETPLPKDTVYLFSVRYEMEKEARRILDRRSNEPIEHRRTSFGQLISTLIRFETIDPEIAKAAKDIYSICSLAIHGEDISPAKVSFVRDLGPRVIEALKGIENE